VPPAAKEGRLGLKADSGTPSNGRVYEFTVLNNPNWIRCIPRRAERGEGSAAVARSNLAPELHLSHLYVKAKIATEAKSTTVAVGMNQLEVGS
jgi:hypothetical protein